MTEFQFGFIYDAYKAEVEVMHKIDAQAPFYAVVCTAFGGVVSYLFIHASEVDDGDYRMMVVTLAIMAAIFLALAIYQLARSYVGVRYRFTPNAVAVEAYLRGMNAAFPGNPTGADEAARAALAGQLAQVADFNRVANRQRYARYNTCAYFLIVSLLFWAVAGTGFVLTKG